MVGLRDLFTRPGSQVNATQRRKETMDVAHSEQSWNAERQPGDYWWTFIVLLVWIVLILVALVILISKLLKKLFGGGKTAY